MDVVLKDTDLTLEADSNLMEQVLINLMVNSIEAVKDKNDAKIVLSADITLNGKVIIKVADNGAGMSEEVMEKIFIPLLVRAKPEVVLG